MIKVASTVTCLVLALALGYMGAYFALVERSMLVRIGSSGFYYPSYHRLPEQFFAPAHKLDRFHLRPKFWYRSFEPISVDLKAIGIDWTGLKGADGMDPDGCASGVAPSEMQTGGGT